MLLHNFLKTYKNEILLLSAEKTKLLAGAHDASDQLNIGIPIFYEQLIRSLEEKKVTNPPPDMLASAATHGKEFLRLGYSLSHVVHAYGSMCQAITELATMKSANITALEFNILNGCLDVGIASAVSEFQFQSNQASEKREITHLGFLAHELRNALSSATIAHEMIKAGLVGTSGSTAAVLEANLTQMKTLIDRSLCEVRMRSDSDLFIEKFYLSELIDQSLLACTTKANNRQQHLVLDVDRTIEIEADRQYIYSAVDNLIQNAIKYSKANSEILIHTHSSDDRVIIEIEDQCGGIDKDKISSLFEPFTKADVDRSGLGLGLNITKQAVHLSQGTISVKNKPGTGCIFSLDIPQKIAPVASQKSVVHGKDSVQPDFLKKS